MTSLPARGAWIEIVIPQSVQIDDAPSLPARGAWIEMFTLVLGLGIKGCRSPHGERGLK